jgi:predicted RNA-binding Zn ribbon-like protein
MDGMTVSPQFAQLGQAVYEAAERAADLLDVLRQDGDVRDALAAVLYAYGEPEPLDITLAELADLRQAGDDLGRVFMAADTGAAADIINELLAGCARPPRLTSHDGGAGWHLHVDSSDDAPLGEWFLTSSCLALAILLAERQQRPAGICASPSCRRPFVNTGRGSERRYCSAPCGTRERVAAHRRASAPHRLSGI